VAFHMASSGPTVGQIDRQSLAHVPALPGSRAYSLSREFANLVRVVD
jgi:hypothetical protein